ESPELGEAQREPAAIVDRWRCGGAETLVDPVGGQGGEIAGGQLDHVLVLAAKIVRLLEIRRREDAESRVSKTSGNLQGAVAGHEGVVQLAEQRMKIGHDRTRSSSLALVVQPAGQRFALPRALQRWSTLAELVQHQPQVEADLEALAQRGRAFWKLLDRLEGLVEPAPGIAERRARRGLEPRLSQIVNSLLTQLSSQRVMGEPLHLSAQVILVEPLDRIDDPAVKRSATLAQQSAVRDLVQERMLEGVLEIRIEAGLVQELGGLQGVESAPERLLGQIRNRCEERVWHVLAPDDRGDLQQAFVLRRELIDARGEQRLGGGRDLDRLDGSSQPIFASLPGQLLRSHEGSNRFLQKGRVPAPNEELLERRKAGVVSEQGIQQLSRALDRKRVESNLTVEGLAGPGVLVLGPVAHEQQELRRADA